MARFRAFEARQTAAWPGFATQPMGEKVRPAPPSLIEYLLADNEFQGFPNQPRSVVAPQRFDSALRAALAELPVSVVNLVNPKLVGILLVEDLGGTAYVDTVFDADKRQVGGFVVLDVAVLLDRTANEWLTWRENTPFAEQGDVELEATIAPAEIDDMAHAIQFIVLHEFGHIASIGLNEVAPWDIRSKPYSAYPFTAQSWKTQRGWKYVSKYDERFPDRSRVQYYGPKEKRLDRSMIVPLYQSLAETNFPTLYAVVRPGDDFAESLATYVHTQLLGRPYEVRIKQAGSVLGTWTPCWGRPVCEEKEKILESLLD